MEEEKLNEIETVEEPQNMEPEQEAVPPASEEERQSSEDNARFAAARRKAESEYKAKLSAYQQETDAKISRMAKQAGLQDVKSVDDYVARMENLALERRLQDGNVTADEIRQMVDESVNASPVVIQARNALAQQRMEEDVRKIAGFDSDIHSLEDLYASEHFDAVLSRVQSGMNLVDAYRLENFDRLMEKKSAAVKQAAINQAKGKTHMEPVGGSVERSGGGEDIPERDLAKWKEAFPDATYAQLKEKYNRARKT